MKLTVIPLDKAVYKDGRCYEGLNLDFVPSNIHAFQWFDTKGWIEFTRSDDDIKTSNEFVLELPSWADNAVSLWEAAKVAEEAAKVAEEAAKVAEEAAKVAEEAAKVAAQHQDLSA